jgi:hypothetical protein
MSSLVSGAVGLCRSAWGIKQEIVQPSVTSKVVSVVKKILGIPSAIRNAVTRPLSRLPALAINRALSGHHASVSELVTKEALTQAKSAFLIGSAVEVVAETSRMVALAGTASYVCGAGLSFIGSVFSPPVERHEPGFLGLFNRRRDPTLFERGCDTVSSVLAAPFLATGSIVKAVSRPLLEVDLETNVQERLVLPVIKKVSLEVTAKAIQVFVMNHVFGLALLKLAGSNLKSMFDFSLETAGSKYITGAHIVFLAVIYGPAVYHSVKMAKACLLRNRQIEQIKQNLALCDLSGLGRFGLAGGGLELAIGSVLESQAVAIGFLSDSPEETVQLFCDATNILGPVAGLLQAHASERT